METFKEYLNAVLVAIFIIAIVYGVILALGFAVISINYLDNKIGTNVFVEKVKQCE